MVGELRAAMVSAREAGAQQRLLKRSALAGVLAGIFIWALLPGIVAATLPDSWHLRERLAALSLGDDRLGARGRLIASVDSDRWSDILTADRIVQGNRETIAGCVEDAEETDEPVRCTVTFAPYDNAAEQ